MKNGERVVNRFVSYFMVETSGYDSPRTNQGPLRRTSAGWGNTAKAVCIDATSYAPCVDQRGVDDTIISHLDNLRKPLTCTVSELTYEVQDRGGGAVRRLTDGLSFKVSSVRVEFPAQIKLI